MQPMVEAAKHIAREDFSEWLNAHCARLGAPLRGRPKWLKDRLKTEVKLKVSYETCRKWLGGLELPDRANEALLHKALGVQVQAEENDPAFDTLRRIWRTLAQKGKDHVLETAFLAQNAARAENLEPKPEQKKKRQTA